VDLLAGYDSANPLPRSYVIELTPEYVTSERIREFADGLVSQPMVAEVHYGQEWLEKEETTKGLIWKVGLALGIVILLTALITTINSIRLSSRARARGFEQMKLLGAGRIFLAAPFVIEGFLLGGLSALCGWGIIWYAQGYVSFTQLALVLPPTEYIIGYCLLMALVGIVSGYMGIRKPMREV
jgi:cell division transport system permease protein